MASPSQALDSRALPISSGRLSPVIKVLSGIIGRERSPPVAYYLGVANRVKIEE
jgi:hypothetical protein